MAPWPQPQSDQGDDSFNGNDEGASGPSDGSFTLSHGAMIAIIIVVVVVCIFGITSSVLFYVAKKRSWEVRASIRKSAKRVAAVLTPRRSEFPSSVKREMSSSKGRVRLDDAPPTPKMKSRDLEKGNSKIDSIELKESKKPSTK